MITKNAYNQRPKGTEYEVNITQYPQSSQLQLALIHSSEGSKLWEHDIVLIKQPWGLAAYMGVYNQAMTAFEFIALGWLSIPSITFEKAYNESESYGNVFDFYIEYEDYRKCLPLQWPYKTFEKNLEFYLNRRWFSLYQ